MAKTKAKNTNTNKTLDKSTSSKAYAKWTPEYRDAAERRGMSMTAFVMDCVFKEIANESI